MRPVGTGKERSGNAAPWRRQQKHPMRKLIVTLAVAALGVAACGGSTADTTTTVGAVAQGASERLNPVLPQLIQLTFSLLDVAV